MGQIEQDDYASVSEIFNTTMLQKLGLDADIKLRTLFASAER
jgi:hypothetical protein